MPVILEEIMQVLDDLHPNADYNCKLNILLAKTAQMLSFKRICFKELENIKLINHYAINFMPSGMGKDKICDDLDKFIFKGFLDYFKAESVKYKIKQEKKIEDEANKLYSEEKQQNNKNGYIETEKSKIRDLDLEINSATIEGFFADAKALAEAGFGSLFVKISEFGMLLLNNRKDEMLFFTGLLEAYDGKVSSKSTKYAKRESSVENMPVNTLLHSDYNLFKSDIQAFFDKLMQTGFARRATISFQQNNTQSIDKNPKEARMRQEQAYKNASIVSSELHQIFLNILNNSIYVITDEAYDNVFYPFKLKIIELSNANQSDDKLNKEIRSRELKVLKLAGMFACLNHPMEPFVYESDVEQAIYVVEQLSQDFKKFLDFKPNKTDNYELLFNFLADNLDKEFTKTQLVNDANNYGFKRDLFRKEFDSVFEIIAEMATEKGYYLQKKKINNNSGLEISLVKSCIGDKLPEGVKTLNELV